MSINNFVGVGRIVADIELRYTASGTAVGNFTLAMGRPFKNASGEQETDFVRCVAWRKQAENAANFVKKGDRIGVTGRIETGSYDDKDGKKVYTTEVVAENIQFLQDKKERQGQSIEKKEAYQESKGNPFTKQETNQQSQGKEIDIDGDELPF